MKTISLEEFKAQYGAAAATSLGGAEQKPAEASLGERLGKIGIDAASHIQEDLTGGSSYAEVPRRAVNAVAEGFGVVPMAANELLPQSVRDAEKPVAETVSRSFTTLTDAISSIPGLSKLIISHPKISKAIEEAAGTGSGLGEIAGDILAADAPVKGAQVGAAGVKKAAEAAASGASSAVRATTGLLERSKGIVSPSPTATEAVGEVLQGKTMDIKPGIQALAAKDAKGAPVVDTTGVKTNIALKGRLDDAISRLSRQVDEHLAQDPTPRLLDDLATKTTSKAGNEVSRNYVSDALDHLKELYTKTADDASLSDVSGIIEKAKASGLTRQEVNDVSRLYNTEFGDKAFGKLGEPLTSVNAQMYENIRKGLKGVARDGIGGGEAAKADRIISSLYTTRKLVAKNVEAVQRLQQRIEERGLLEKVGHTVAKYADILTGGTIRGLVGGLLPHGAGYKVLNAVDLEDRLERNLKIISKAAESGSEEDIRKAVEALQP